MRQIFKAPLFIHFKIIPAGALSGLPQNLALLSQRHWFVLREWIRLFWWIGHILNSLMSILLRSRPPYRIHQQPIEGLLLEIARVAQRRVKHAAAVFVGVRPGERLGGLIRDFAVQ